MIWRPSKRQRREFAERMANDPEFRNAYYARKEARREKRINNSEFDYASAGGYYKPSVIQFQTAIKLSNNTNITSKMREACEAVIVAYNGNTTCHHDYIHLINMYIRNEN